MENKTSDEDPALAETQAATPSDGARAVESSRAGSSDSLVGELLADKYRILKVVGEGGMGRVYRAEHTVTGATVAVKVLAGRFGSTPERAVLERFLREVRTTAALNHPGIVRLYDAGDDKGIAYLVMEHLEGENLAARCEREGVFFAEEAVAIVLQICEALHFAHERGVVHRDLKPENIFLTQGFGDGQTVKVVDFGIAKAYENAGRTLTQDGEALGTPEYMAPEQARGETVDSRADVYAVGLIIYQMLAAGHMPHADAIGSNSTPVRVLHIKGVDTPPTPITDYCPDLPPALACAVMRALENDPAARPQTMEQFAQELRAAMEAPPAPHPSLSQGERGNRRLGEGGARSAPVLWVGVAVAAVLVISVGAMVARSGKPAPVSAEPKPPSVKPASRSAAAPFGFGAPADSAGKPAESPSPSVATVPQVQPTPTPSGKPAPAISPPRNSVRGGVRGGAKGADAPLKESARKRAPTPPASMPRSAERGKHAPDRDDARFAKVAELRKAAQDTKVALRRNPRNRELRARLNGVCRELQAQGETIPECQ